MLIDLLQHQWKRSVRSILWQRTVVSSVFLGLILAIFSLNALGIGLYIDKLLLQVYPDEDHIKLINGILLYYLFFELIFRYFMQKFSGLDIEPYLCLPVKRSSLIHYILLKTAFTYFNFFPLFLLIPILINIIIPATGIFNGLVWLFSCLFLLFTNGLWSQLLKQWTVANPLRILIAAAVLIAVALLDNQNILTLSSFSAQLFGYILQYPVLIIFIVLYVLLVYQYNFQFHHRHIYPEHFRQKIKPGQFDSTSLSFMDQFGDIGYFIKLELKMLFRNKRTRATLSLPLMMILIVPLFYGTMKKELDFYPEPDEQIIAQPNKSIYDALVTFKVIPGPIPQNAHVYITGDHRHLGPWKPSNYVMELNPDSSWSRTFAFPKGTTLRYIHTLGSWKTECVKGDSLKPATRTINVANDTTIVWDNPQWKEPRLSSFIDGMIVYMGFLFVCILMLAYGQFMLAWESSYFDLLIARGISFRKYFTAKYIILLICGVILYMLNALVAFYSVPLFLINTAIAVYNLGINSLLLLYLSSFNRKRMDLDASIMSTQGKSAVHYSMIIPTVILPAVLYVIVRIFTGPELALITLAGLGILGLIFYKPAFNLILKQFDRQRYKISAGFNQT